MPPAAAQTTIDISRLPAELASYAIDPAKLDWRPVERDASVYLAARARRRFEESRGPDGSPWKPLKRRRKGGGRKPLRDTGRLMASVTAKAAVARGVLAVEQGSNVHYAGFHQYGTRTIPARPFLGLGGQDADRLARLAADRLVKQYLGGA